MNRTSTLFAMPSFIRGMSTILDVGATQTIYNTSNSADEADYKAIYSDWAAVGDDIHFAIIRWETENEAEKK